MTEKIAYGTPTSEILLQLLREENPVTRWALADIIGKRIDRQEARYLEHKQ